MDTLFGVIDEEIAHADLVASPSPSSWRDRPLSVAISARSSSTCSRCWCPHGSPRCQVHRASQRGSTRPGGRCCSPARFSASRPSQDPSLPRPPWPRRRRRRRRLELLRCLPITARHDRAVLVPVSPATARTSGMVRSVLTSAAGDRYRCVTSRGALLSPNLPHAARNGGCFPNVQ